MCKQPNGSVSTRTLGGNKQDVTSKSKDKSKRASGSSTGKAAQNCKGNKPAPSTDARSNQGNPRSDRSGKSASGQPSSSRAGVGNKKRHNELPVQLPSTGAGSRPSTSNRAAGLSREQDTERSICDVSGIWKTSKVHPHLRGTIRGIFKVDQELLLVATWTALIEDLCPKLSGTFSRLIATDGLASVISRFQQIASVLINDSYPTVLDEEIFHVLKEIPLRDALQVLRFGKRYTPAVWSDEKAREVMTKFHARNNRAKMFERREMPYWFVKRLSEIGAKIVNSALKGRKFSDILVDRSFEVDYHHLPNGTTADGLKTPFEKWAYISSLWNELDPIVNDAIDTRSLGQREDVYSKLVLVPKDYRGPRVIMEELLETVLQQSVVADGIMYIIHNSTPVNMPFLANSAILLDDQTQNQDMARLGALHGYHTTLDLKDASDSITYNLLHAVFPPEVYDAIASLTTRWVLLPDGKTHALHMPCTMGSRLTVPVQSLVYWVIVCAAAQYLVDMGVIPDLSILKDCSVYNDDIIIPWILDETVRSFLGFAGLVVNDDKSFTDGDAFRESCGEDYYYDSNVTSVYWPRRDLSLANEDVPSLCALQNRLYMIGAAHAESVVRNYIQKALCPKVPCIKPSDPTIGVYTDWSNRKVRPYICDDVRHVTKASVSVSEHEPFLGHKTLSVRFTNNPKFLSGVVSLHTVKDLLPYLDDPWIDRIEVFHALQNTPTECIDPDDARNGLPIVHRQLDASFRRVSIDGFYRVTYPVILGTYDNRKVKGLKYDKRVITPYVLDQLTELFDYQHWLIHGSEYHDDLCKFLHITRNARISDRMVQVGYKVGTYTATTLDQTLLNRAQTEFEQRTKRKEEEGKNKYMKIR